MVNGFILLAGERLRRRSERRIPVTVGADGGAGPPSATAAPLDTGAAVRIGAAQILALFAGISRSGVTMTAGLLHGLDHDDAARFSFLLATPIILAAGLYKLPDLLAPLGGGIPPPLQVGRIPSGRALHAARTLAARR